ncbi:FAD-dependent monooxygenase [Nocardioides flavescens]|uniref:FAD-binding monooxygenase n=1 Tax=Nocardioides flavescens TaxID=2691959 RepID=A0A6L7F0S6_9ACTN|nr:FAD-dependent monooxygenase [Nocardioides flavescens]MXG88474.1 FAD-binding monooxygenase [Nocardioides flavescens]
MTRPHALVSGASVAGLSTAFWLERAGWSVTVLERAPAFRDGGQNVDVRGVAREVVDRMGLLEAIRERNTTETGTVIVDDEGGEVAELPSEGPDGPTAELEILRGDLARVVLDALPDTVEVRYDATIASVDSGTRPGDGGVGVTLASGETLIADLLVVAEGVRSTTRDLVFGDEVELRELGITMAFGTIARTPDDDHRWRWCTTTEGRQVHLRPDPYGTTRAILSFLDGPDERAGRGGRRVVELGRDEQLALLRERYDGVGWEAPRVLEGFATSDDVYVDDLAQTRMTTWSRGRVVLAGDAAWCVTPMGGGGSSLALTGGYVLASCLATDTSAPSAPGDPGAALAAYDAWMRPLVDDVQDFPQAVLKLAYPRTRAAVVASRVVTKAMTTWPLSRLTAKVSQVADTDRELPAEPTPGGAERDAVSR